MKTKIGTIGTMTANIKSVTRQGGYVVGTMEVPGAVPWDIVAALNRREVWKILQLAIKPSIIALVLFGLKGKEKLDLPESEEDEW